MQGVDQAELLDRRQCGAVAELDGAGADPDGARRRGGQGQQHGGRGPGDPRVQVVLGEPVAGVAEGLRLPGEVDAVVEGVGGGGTGRDRDEVEDPEGDAGHGLAP